ncbi:MAG: hypothetical protein AAF808_08905 [Cyanobacteria bacterium P01_D01_bin.2]
MGEWVQIKCLKPIASYRAQRPHQRSELTSAANSPSHQIRKFSSSTHYPLPTTHYRSAERGSAELTVEASRRSPTPIPLPN